MKCRPSRAWKVNLGLVMAVGIIADKKSSWGEIGGNSLPSDPQRVQKPANFQRGIEMKPVR